MNNTYGGRPLVHLFSDANFLSVSILETLVSKNCFVNIISSDEKKWRERTRHLTGNPRFSILNKKSFSPVDTISYAIFCQGFIKNENPFSDFKHFRRQNFFVNTKTLVIIPFEKFSLKESSTLSLNDNTGVVYLGDLLGPRIDLESKLLISKSLAEALTLRSMTFGVGEKFYPMFAPEVAKTLGKWLLSFGPFGKEIFFLGSEVSASDFWKTLESLIKGIKIKFDEKVEPRFLPKNYEIRSVTHNLRFSLSETFRFMAMGGNKISMPGIKIPVRIPRRLILWTLTFLFIFLFPFVSVGAASGLLANSFRNLISGNESNFQNKIFLAKTIFVIGRSESDILRYIPILGRVYEEASFISKVGENVSDSAVIAPSLLKSSSDLFTKILGNDIYNPQIYSDEIKTDLGLVYQSAATIEAETKYGEEKRLISAGWLKKRVDFEKIKNVSLHGETLVGNLPSILGSDKRKSYLVLFQNNMELRPTGGFIGSYGTATFDGGRMIELNINDVYSADGQLRGHVEPPEAIKNYLGEANWWLRDSNWDPDFPTSAQRAEWFLDKEVDTQVDGVMGIDLSVVRGLLKYTGAIFLPDYNLDITTENLYEKTQAEVQDNFFPGSRKKASFLTALSRSLIVEISKLDGSSKFLALKSIFDNLETRAIQVFLHDDVSQNAISTLGWSGEVFSPSCGEGRYPDFLGIIEANVGVNKANYFITRNVEMWVSRSSAETKRVLTLNLQNSANTNLGPSGRYKAYVRILIPEDSEVSGVRKIVGQSSQVLPPEVSENKGKKEVGVLIEVLGGQTAALEFNWQSTPPEGTVNYALYVRKQAGVGEYPFALTINGASIYNTSLVKDIWTKKF